MSLPAFPMDAVRLLRGLTAVMAASAAELSALRLRPALVRAAVAACPHSTKHRAPAPSRPPPTDAPYPDSNPPSTGNAESAPISPTASSSSAPSSSSSAAAADIHHPSASKQTTAMHSAAAAAPPLDSSTTGGQSLDLPGPPLQHQDQLREDRPPLEPTTFTIRENPVPESPLSRVAAFASLATGLVAGAAAESARRMTGFSAPSQHQPNANTPDLIPTSPFITDANAQRLAASLSRMRGAALKLGQMLSIQDDAIIPPQVLRALERVRQGADVMPRRQLERVLVRELGHDWLSRVVDFDFAPVAAASIGQVHRGVIRVDDDDQQPEEQVDVAFKVQYPGVARSIKSDLNNLRRLVTIGNFVPDNFFLDEALAAAEEELARECDYDVELLNQEHYRNLIHAHPVLNRTCYVPRVFPSFSTKHVLVSEFVNGVPVDKLASHDQHLRDHVASTLLRLTLAELFVFAFQQSDPNWSNYLYDEDSGVVNLIDFGAARPYDEDFLLRYLALIRACAARDREAIIDHSIRLGFLTGEETKEMMNAHVQASFAVGEPFQAHHAERGFDFTKNDIPVRAAQFGKVMLKYRLTPPPKEVYSLHRRLSGAFLMSTRLGARINAAEMLNETVRDLITMGRVSE